MANFRNKVLILVPFLVSSFIFTGTSTRLHDNMAERDLVSSTCKKTLYFQLCVSSLRSDPRSKSSDLRGLAAIALNQSIAKGVDNLAYINNLRSQSASAGSQEIVNVLGDCVTVYSDAIQGLQDSVQALNDKSYDTLQSLVSAAMTDSETCEDGFKEIKDSGSPLTEQNQYFSKLCSNFLAITTLLV